MNKTINKIKGVHLNDQLMVGKWNSFITNTLAANK